MKPYLAKYVMAGLALVLAPPLTLAQTNKAQGNGAAAERHAAKQAEKDLRHGAKQEQKREQQAARPFAPGGAGRAQVPSRWIERLQGMSPEEQQRFMQNNEHFLRLPPERQGQIRQNLERWNRLTPDQRQEMIHRWEALEKLTPEQRHRLNEEILPRWQQLPMDRRQAIRRRLNELAKLDEKDREARLRDEEFLKGMNPEDRDMLRNLASLRLGMPPEHPEPPLHDEP